MSTEQSPPSQPPDLPKETSPDMFGELMAKGERARKLWNVGGELRSSHDGKTEKPLREVLLEGGVPGPKVDFFLNVIRPPGEMKEPVFEFDFKKVTPDELSKIIHERLYLADEMVNVSLNVGHKKRGMNRHDKVGHIDNVERRSRELVSQLIPESNSEANDLMEKTTIVIAILHDEGNIPSRVLHAFLSSRYGFKLVPELTQDPEIKNKISKGVFLHEVKVAGMYLDYLGTKLGENTPEYFAGVRDKFGGETLVVLASDIADGVNQDRVSDDTEIPKEILNSDKHTLLSALAISGEYKYESLTSSSIDFIQRSWIFDPKLPGDSSLMKRILVFLNGKHEGEVVVPRWMHNLHEHSGVPYFFTWFTNLCSLQAEQMKVEATALCALSDRVQQVRLMAEDNSMWEMHGIKMRFELKMHRSEINEMNRWIKEKMTVHEGRAWVFENMPTAIQSEVRSMQRMNIAEHLKKSSWLERPLHESDSKKSHLKVVYEFDTDPAKRRRIAGKVTSLFSPRIWRGTKFWEDIRENDFDEGTEDL